MYHYSNYNPRFSCFDCRSTAQKRSQNIRCVEENRCPITKSTEIPPELNEHSQLAFEVYEETLFFSGIDPMTGYQKYDKFDSVIDGMDRQLTQEEYDLLKNKFKLIYMQIETYKAEDRKNPVGATI